ncbi:hypothetical protein B7R21_17350 [Subtercola boreus]|uniref:Enoyl reductase (ER) domain-containing protein n=2 Tax=Subtercola boreus TaxID=120213 RepID=A0A3E0VB74_9MICO|nr:hypothetical protein B7R21_17350 [Subtercola boreus]
MTIQEQGASFVRTESGDVVVELRAHPRQPVDAGELRVQPQYIGICGTDLEILHDRMPENFDTRLPHTLGHEWSGIVVETGPGSDGFAIGDRVLGHGHMGGNDWFGATHDGAASDSFVIAAHMCHHVPAGVDLLTAAIIEPFACVLQGFQKAGGVTAGDTVHVYGLGAIGLAAVIHCVTVGARVVAFDLSPLRRSRAIELGCEAALDPRDVGKAERDALGLADLVLEASGARAAQASALESAAPRGRVLLMGLSRPTETDARLSLIVERDLTVLSSVGAPTDIWEPAIRYVDRARIDLGRIVTSTLPLSRVHEAFDRAQDAQNEIKVMLRPDGADAR